MAMVILTEFFWFYLCSAVQEGILRRSRKIKERADWPFGFDASLTLDLLLLPFGFVAGDDNCRQLFIVFAGIVSLYKLNPGSRLEMWIAIHVLYIWTYWSRKTCLNCILQDLFRDTPFDHIPRAQICAPICQMCQICNLVYFSDNHRDEEKAQQN